MQFGVRWFLLFLIIKPSKPVVEFEFHDKIARFDAFLDRCSKDTYYPIHNENTRVFKVDNKYYYNWELVVDKYIDFNEGRLVVQRCASKEALDTCIKFTNFRTKSICTLLHTKESPLYASIKACMNRKHTCPMAMGHYKGTNCTVNMNLVNIIPFGNYYWRGYFELVDKQKNAIYCVRLEGGLVRKKN